MTIRILPPEVAAQIAAGEVVERPASVVKELVENALDAGARTISVEIEAGGKRLIRIGDDGHGIPSDQVELAFQRHATSKLTTVHDLDHITTLGFRGEALASIASVSQMSVITRSADEQMGMRLTLEGGAITNREISGAPQGTLISVENLFYNVPARLKFLKTDNTERKRIGALISRYAMAYPGVRFTLRHGKQEALQTTGSGDLHTVLTEVFGIDVAGQMLEVSLAGESALRDDLPAIEVYGFTGQPSLTRSNRSQITLFINGRWIQDSSLTYAVVQAYHTMLISGRYPVAVLMITLPPDEVDVNVHPTKAEVRFRRADAVFSTVQRAVRRTLVDQAELPDARREILWGTPDWQTRRDRLSQVTVSRANQLGMDMDLQEPGQYSKQSSAEDAAPEAPARRRKIPMMRVIGQAGATYIVTEGPGGLYLIDQHAAHERILYEQFLAEQGSEEVASQELLETLTVELLPDQMALVTEYMDHLHELGFVVEEFGRNTVSLRAIPAILAGGEPVDGLLAAIGQFDTDELPAAANPQERLAARICKQAAVKAGQTLSFAEMQAMMRQLENCEAPQTNPQGQPTMIHISAEQLAREFGRLDDR